MTYKLNLLRQLIDHVEEYEHIHENSDIKEFSLYLKDKVIMDEETSSTKYDKSKFRDFKSFPEVEFSTLITNLNRFAKHYMKKAFHDSKINTLDEFGFLATLLREESLLKNELINRHLLEISSGSEIIKRLIKNGLIQEMPDENDKRAKRVSLTQIGKIEIFESFDEMHKVSEIIIGNLKPDEIRDALGVFNKLNYFHLQIHKEDKNSTIDEIHIKHIS